MMTFRFEHLYLHFICILTSDSKKIDVNGLRYSKYLALQSYWNSKSIYDIRICSLSIILHIALQSLHVELTSRRDIYSQDRHENK
jgi:hypothetical protein